MLPFALAVTAIGLFVICCSIFNWEFFFQLSKVKRMSEAIGRNTARMFYGIIGFAIALFGILGATGAIDIVQVMMRR
ncbi:MAG: Imm17 family immunity protein [Pirellulales bacterium]